MRFFLRDNSVNVPISATYTNVLELFCNFYNDEHAIFFDDIHNIKYPLLLSSTLNILHESSNNIERLMTVPVRQIGKLIQNFEIDVAMVLGLVHLLGCLADIPLRKEKECLSSKCVVPWNLVNMATNARVHTSQRLLARGLWHATDQASPDIFDGRINLGHCNNYECKGEVYIIIKKMSMLP
jgi:hypothetical protein